MEEDGENLTPFWQQSFSLRGRRRRRRFSSFFLNSGLLLFLLCVTALFFIFVVVPSILAFTAQIFRPNTVKKSWDSLNVVLVLFALVIGFLSRIKNYDSRFEEDSGNVLDTIRNEVQKSNQVSPRQWYEYSDQTVYGGGTSAMGGLSLRRTSSSYPDLREVSSSVNADDRWGFFDDTQVDSHRYLDSDGLRRRPSWKRVEGGGDHTMTIHVETLVNRAKEASYTPPPSPPPAAVHRKPKRAFESVALKERRNEQVKESRPAKFPTPPAIPPQPSPPVSPEGYSEKKSIKSDRKRGDANTTKDFLASIYHQRKKKKRQKQKSVDNFETLLQNQDPLNLSIVPNLFSSQKGQNKKILSVPPPPPPPPLPPVTKVGAPQKTPQIAPIAARETPLPVKISRFNNSAENSNSGGESPLTGSESPLISIPPPPPPPFKIPSWKFVVKGDYVRIGSMNSSRSSGSSNHDDAESPTREAGGTPTAGNGGEAVAPLFCPSPDVNTKADMFIANFRAGLQLQKINSMKRKQGLGLSNLSPETKSGPGPSQT